MESERTALVRTALMHSLDGTAEDSAAYKANIHVATTSTGKRMAEYKRRSAYTAC